MDLKQFMKFALSEAKTSLKEGNNGFGAVIIKDSIIVASAHDQEVTKSDPTAHAEMIAIRIAAEKIGKDMKDCILISTHEPCPMCSSAIVWSGISGIAYGYSIKEAIAQGRNRIDLSCTEIFERAGVRLEVYENILHEECSVLYRKDVRDTIKMLRKADKERLEKINQDLIEKRLCWFENQDFKFKRTDSELPDLGYKLLLNKLNISAEEALVVERSENKIIFHSKNFCPALEACKILDLDTRTICKVAYEESMDSLMKKIDPRLEFKRNYEKLRPYSNYCEEMIILNRFNS
jgi:tRNA(adenine34) deaminase